MSRSYLKHRSRAFHCQSGRCYYCGTKMWLSQPGNFASKFNISQREIYRFQCTAEHLEARQDGGTDKQNNIVAACRFCNRTRHVARKPLPPGAYKARIIRQLKKGAWHPRRLHHLLSLGDG